MNIYHLTRPVEHCIKSWISRSKLALIDVGLVLQRGDISDTGVEIALFFHEALSAGHEILVFILCYATGRGAFKGVPVEILRIRFYLGFVTAYFARKICCAFCNLAIKSKNSPGFVDVSKYRNLLNDTDIHARGKIENTFGQLS